MNLLPDVAVSLSLLCAFFYEWSSGLDTTGRAIEYVYYTDKHSWNEARNVCRSIGGELATVDSQQTIDDILQLSLDQYAGDDFMTRDDFWIGLYDASETRRQFVIGCSELTFTSNYIEDYHDNELCFKLKKDEWIGISKPCSEDSPFLCEIHPAGPCSFRYEMTNVSAIDVGGVNDFAVCEDHCAYDVTCSGALFVSTSVCYKLPYNTSNVTASGLATMSSKFCISFKKNESVVSPWENKLKYPVGVCGATPTNRPDPTPSIFTSDSTATFLLSTSTINIIQTCSPIVLTTHVTEYVMPTYSPISTVTVVATPTYIPVSTVTVIATPTHIPVSTVTVVATPTHIPVSTVTVVATPTHIPVSTVTVVATPTHIPISTVTVVATPTYLPVSTVTEVAISTYIAISTITVVATPTHIPVSTVTVVATPTHDAFSTVTIFATPSCELTSTIVSVNLTIQEVFLIADRISKNLTIDTKKTSSHIRSLTSAHDYRPSATAMGSVGIGCVALPIALLICLDLRKFVNDFRGIKRPTDKDEKKK